MGLAHDFNQRWVGGHLQKIVRHDSNGVYCGCGCGNGINALMDYVTDYNDWDKFSTCSKEDFKNEYNKVVRRDKSYCLTCGKPLYCFFL